MKKQYNNCTDVERHIIREYTTWRKSDAPEEYRRRMMRYWWDRSKEAGINHLIIR